MKTRWIVTLIGTVGLLGSNAVLAHNEGYRYGSPGPAVNGGVAVWIDSYGNVRYGANLAYGSPRVYAAAPYGGYAHGARCDHPSHYAYNRGYYKDHKHKHKNKHRKEHKHQHGKRHH